MTEPTGDPFLDAVAAYWDEILDLAGPERADVLRGLVAGAAEPDPVDARAALADELLDLLPAGHPLLDVLRSGTMLDPGTSLALHPELIAAALRRLADRDLLPAAAGEPAGGAPFPPMDWFDREVRRRLLQIAALEPDQIRRHGADPIDHRLIRLVDSDGTVRFPAFQFSDPPYRPLGVVLDVNELLGAPSDPWGVACWWVDRHAGLGVPPRDLLGRGRDQLLRAAASALEED